MIRPRLGLIRRLRGFGSRLESLSGVPLEFALVSLGVALAIFKIFASARVAGLLVERGIGSSIVYALSDPLVDVAFWLAVGVLLLASALVAFLNRVLPPALAWVAKADRGRRWQRVVLVATIVAGAAAIAGVAILLTSRIETGRSSLPYLRPVLIVVTSTYTYILLAGWLFRRLLLKRRTLWANRAAAETNLSPRTVKRLAEETKTPDGGTRAILFSGDSLEEIRRRLDDALESREDDTLSFREGEDVDIETDPFEWVDVDPNERVSSDELPLSIQLEHLRMDLGASLEWDRVFWSLVVPAATVVAVLLIAFQIWVEPLVYGVILLIGLGVGLANYLRVRLTLSRRLDNVRAEERSIEWSKIAVHMKTVETPEVTVYMAWLLGTTYASTDRDELVDEVAERAKDKLDGYYPKPSLLEKYADQLRDYYPDLGGFRDDEKIRVMTALMDAVESTSAGVLPREKLIADVVEYDRPGRYEEVRTWEGYDPDLVREAYEEIVPERLAEITVRIEERGEEREITAVTSAKNPVDPNHAQVRSEFSNLYSNYHGEATRYGSPDPDLDGEPPRKLAVRSIEDLDLEEVPG
jgi:hypothetical protein